MRLAAGRNSVIIRALWHQGTRLKLTGARGRKGEQPDSRHPPGQAAHPYTLETTSMFKKLIPVIALALIAGPVLAADPPPAGGDAATPAAKSSHHKSKHHKKAKQTGSSTDSTATAPAK
jgi:hypothetical protein